MSSYPRFVVEACKNGWVIFVYKNSEPNHGGLADERFVAKSLTELSRILVNQSVETRVRGLGER